jgi:hypothetical protein
MSPIELRFNDGMEFAHAMRHSGRTSYWGGYVAGLMRGLFGDEAIANRTHQLLVDPSVVEDHARGYRDGFAYLVPLAPVSGQSAFAAAPALDVMLASGDSGRLYVDAPSLTAGHSGASRLLPTH